MEPVPKLVIIYDGANNSYSVLAHNLNQEQAIELSQQPVGPQTALIVDQRRAHKTPNAEDCRTCRDDVIRAAKLQPQPKFKRRKK